MVRIGQTGPEQSRNRIPRLGNMCGMHRRNAMQSPQGDGSIGPDRARLGEWPDGARCAGDRPDRARRAGDWPDRASADVQANAEMRRQHRTMGVLTKNSTDLERAPGARSIAVEFFVRFSSVQFN